MTCFINSLFKKYINLSLRKPDPKYIDKVCMYEEMMMNDDNVESSLLNSSLLKMHSLYKQGRPQIMTGLNCQRCTAASCEQSKPFSAWGLGPALGPQKLLGIFITKYAFSPFWGTFLYYF